MNVNIFILTVIPNSNNKNKASKKSEDSKYHLKEASMEYVTPHLCKLYFKGKYIRTSNLLLGQCSPADHLLVHSEAYNSNYLNVVSLQWGE